MKKKTIPAILFILVFIVTYLFLCFGIPGLRIKLKADSAEVFLESVKAMALFKSIISLVAGVVVRIILLFIEKRCKNNMNLLRR